MLAEQNSCILKVMKEELPQVPQLADFNLVESSHTLLNSISTFASKAIFKLLQQAFYNETFQCPFKM